MNFPKQVTAYAVACFGRFIYDDGTVLLQFLFGKCKVCPTGGSLTIPRLELVAASLATRVACSVLRESNVKYGHVYIGLIQQLLCI